MTTEDRPTFIKDNGVRICRVDVPHKNGRHEVLFVREDQVAPWQALGDDVRVTLMEELYVPFVTPEERTDE